MVRVVERDMHFMRSFATSVTVLHAGKVLSEGTVAQVQADPKVQESISTGRRLQADAGDDRYPCWLRADHRGARRDRRGTVPAPAAPMPTSRSAQPWQSEKSNQPWRIQRAQRGYWHLFDPAEPAECGAVRGNDRGAQAVVREVRAGLAVSPGPHQFATADDRSAEVAVRPSLRGDQRARPGPSSPWYTKDGKP
jgi:DNA-binding transcriptional LysR family regulator